MLRKWTALVLVFVLLCSAVQAVQADEGAAKRILVIETTDMHGNIMDVSSGREDQFQYRLARIAYLINEARSSGAYDDVLLLDGGDLYQGTPVSYMTGGAVMRAAADAMRYDAVVLGNHEFDWDVAEYAADQDGTMPPYVLGEYTGDAKIPVLACDLCDAASGQRVPFTRDYAIIEKAGIRIAVIGYIPDFSNTVMAAKIAPFIIDEDLSKLDRLIRDVHAKETPDATVLIVHGNPVLVAEAMDPQQVDLVCGGHSHEITVQIAENGITYIQGGSNANGFACAVLVIDADGAVRVEDAEYRSAASAKAELYDTEENRPRLDAEILAISHAGWDAIQEEMSEVLGYIDTPIQKVRDIGANSAGNWITGLMMQVTQEQGTVAAFYNNGGIRTSFWIPEGQATRNITVSDIYTILPFGNSLLVYEVSGQELARQLASALKSSNYGDQMSGLTFTYTATGSAETPREERKYTILSITLDDGTEVDIHDTQRLYRVCTSNFNATIPGSVFEGKEPVVPEADAPIDNESFVSLLRELREVRGGYIPVDSGPRGVEVR